MAYFEEVNHYAQIKLFQVVRGHTLAFLIVAFLSNLNWF